MDLIKPTCRTALSEQDYAFLLKAFGVREGDDCAFASLLTDTENLDVLLDDDAVFRRVLDSPDFQELSLPLYFYILLRHILLQAGVEDRNVADYLAAMLAAFRHALSFTKFRPEEDVVPECMIDLESAAESFGEPGSFYIRVYMGNFSLLLTGVFPQRIHYRREKFGAPDVGYYAGLGRSNFQWAGNHQLARDEGLADMYHYLGQEYTQIQAALQELGSQFLFLHAS